MKKRNLLLIPFLSFLLFSCSENHTSQSIDTDVAYSSPFYDYPCNTERLEGKIHKISGGPDYFEYNDVLFEILILNRGMAYGGTTRIYIDGKYTNHMDISDDTFKEGEKCYGVLTIGKIDASDLSDANFIKFEVPYLSYLYVGRGLDYEKDVFTCCNWAIFACLLRH